MTDDVVEDSKSRAHIQDAPMLQVDVGQLQRIHQLAVQDVVEALRTDDQVAYGRLVAAGTPVISSSSGGIPASSILD